MKVLTGIGVLLALIEVAFVIYKYAKESARKRRSETLLIYNELFINTYKLQEEYFRLTKEKLFDSKKIHQDTKLLKQTMNHLTLLESFAKGLEYEVYDFQTFISLTPKEFYVILDSLRQFVHDERDEKSYNLLFDDFINMTGVMNLCLHKKLQGKKNQKKIQNYS